MIDTHTHLDSCEPPDAELVAAARAAGVTRIVTVGGDLASGRAALAAAEQFDDVWFATAIHPNYARGFVEADIDPIRELARHERCVAIGETGLDYFHDDVSHDDQKRAFIAHIELARELGKPVMIHTRDADDDTLAILQKYAAGVKVILHCFSMADRIDECLAHENWWISFAGNVTYPRNAPLRDAALKVPAERLLVETDAPYLAPQARRGRPNVPANVVLTAAALAVERRVSYDQLEQDEQRAAAAVFGW